MRSRTQIHQEFVDRFHFGERPALQTARQLDLIEEELRSKLPVAYRQFMTRYGAVHTPTILEMIADKNIDHPDIQEFLDPQEAITGTKGYWSAGMPDDIIGVASDCMGNMIGFRRQTEASDDAPVVFFDHDFVEVSELAPSFDELLTWYLDNLRGS
jgi:hypothetical protein